VNILRFIKILGEFEKPVFTVNDAARILNTDNEYARLYLHRLRSKGVLLAVERNKYSLSDTHPYSIASNLVFPSYISFLTAAHYYGVTTQIPGTIYIASTLSKKSLDFGGYSIDFIKLKKERFFGYSRVKFQNKFIFMAEKEKMILDSLLLPQYCPIDETIHALDDKDLNIENLIEYGIRMDSIVILKRLGFLLDLKGIDVSDKFEAKLNTKYDPLNPFLPRMGRKNRKWKLIINEVFENA
jgi:predicted transcriptional regulator of viral defense system